jgi:monovalent cation:H+ antiporter-2, CPA2 family
LASSPEFVLLLDLGLTILAALGFGFLFSKAKLPIVVGQLVAGMLIGPYGLGLIQDLGVINLLASLGIILLMFTVGLEMDPLDIRKLGPKVIIVTIVELGLTFASVAVVGFWAGLTYVEAIFAAAVVSITSTAILSKLLVETDTLHSKGSQLALTVSVVEDVSSILILILLPGLVAADSQLSIMQFLIFLGKGFLLMIIILGFGLKVAPVIIDRLSMHQEESYRETAFLVALSLGFAFAILSSYFGFSPAIGAFLAGLMIRGRQAKFVMQKIDPVKDLFVVLFFVSMGTLINLGAILTLTIPLFAILSMGIIGKFAGGWAGARLTRANDQANMVGVAMLPRGEFAFIIAQEGAGLGVGAQLLYPVAGLSMLITSVLTSIGLRTIKSKAHTTPTIAATARTPLVRLRHRDRRKRSSP